MQELIKALIKAKAEFNPIQKDGTNPHYKRKYATLDAVLDAVTPGLSKHGLVIIQTTEIFEGKTVLRTHIFHESGENITSTYPLPEIGDSQKFGAALTYARRYAVCAILSVTADEDNDAEGATTPQKPEQPQNNIRLRKDNQQYRVQPPKQAITPPSISPGLHNQAIGEAFVDLIDEAFSSYAQWFKTLDSSSYNDWVNQFKAKLHSSLNQWIDKAGATAGQLLRSLRDKAHQWWYFLENPEVPPDNNQAERSLRLAVTKRKVSGGSRSMERFQHTANLLTVVQTCRRQGRSVINFFVQALLADSLNYQSRPSLLPQY